MELHLVKSYKKGMFWNYTRLSYNLFGFLVNVIVEISVEFEETYEIPYILSTIDNSHIPIVASKIDSKSYYYCKGFYLVLIQDIVNKKCLF